MGLPEHKEPKSHKIPFMLYEVSAGFPNPAESYIEKNLDLNEHLIKRPASTFIVRARGDSMAPYILEGDELIVDKLEEPRDKSIVIAIMDGDFMMKRLVFRGSKKYLMADNPEYNPVEINGPIEIWGVVKHIIRSAQ